MNQNHFKIGFQVVETVRDLKQAGIKVNDITILMIIFITITILIIIFATTITIIMICMTIIKVVAIMMTFRSGC